MSEEETIKSFKSLMYNAKANWEYFNYEILFNFFSLYNNTIEENKKLRENYICAQANANQVFDILKNYVPVQTIKAKIEELDIEISTCEYADDDSEEYKQEVEKNKAELLMAKKVLQQLLESEGKK